MRVAPDSPLGRCPAAAVISDVAGQVQQHCHGVLPDGGPVGFGAMFDLASVTKLFTTLCVADVLTSKLLRLDDPVGRFLDASGPVAQVTIEQLLRHESGLTPWLPLYLFVPDADAAIDLIVHGDWCGQPGTFQYSDLGMMLVGRILAVASCRSLAELMGAVASGYAPEGQFGLGSAEPGSCVPSSLGDRVEEAMVRTGDPYPIPELPRREHQWRTELLVGQPNDGNAAKVFGGLAGHAGLFASPSTLHQVGRTMLAVLAGRDLVPGAEGLRQLARARAHGTQLPGFRTLPDAPGSSRYRSLWHPGFTGCALAIDPERDAVLVLASNRLLADEPPSTNAVFEQVRGPGLVR